MFERAQPSPSPAEYVTLSSCGFFFWWLIILTVHVVTCAYNVGYAKFYWAFNATFLSYILEDYGVGMPRQDFHKIAVVHIVMAVAHGMNILFMLFGSLWQRTITFSPWPDKTGEHGGFLQSEKESSRPVSVEDNRGYGGFNHRSGMRQAATPFIQSVKSSYLGITSRRGVLGVNGRHFHAVHIGREILETFLQTTQAIRMSQYLPHPLLNRFFVGLLVANCWSSMFIYSRWFWHNEAHRRFASIVLDCALDLMSVVGVSAMIVLDYVKYYSVELAGFKYDVLLDDEWVAQMLNEAQMVLVVSWSDLAVRIVFSLGIILTTTSMKDLLRYNPRRSNQIAHAGVPGTNQTCNTTLPTHLRLIPSSAARPQVLLKSSSTKGVTQVVTKRFSDELQTRMYRLAFHGAHFAFAVWGAVILALHVYAVTRKPLQECKPNVYPIAGALPSCFVVNFNCNDLKISTRKEEVRAEWTKFNRISAVKLHFLHCPALEVPESIQDFHKLQEIHVYNSTIVEWGADAALSNSSHPRLLTMSLARVNMTNGLLPLGFQSLDFPVNLLELYFCETNLKEIPDDLDSKWHSKSSVYLENSQLTVVPPALMGLQPYYLVLSGNPITDLPSELFELEGMLYLVLSRTKIRELPQNVTHPSTHPPFVDISNTEVSFFWSWIDPLVEEMQVSFELPMLQAGGSKYCLDLDEVMGGAKVDLSTSVQTDYSPILMNVSEANWEVLQMAVDCSQGLYTFFPLASWDAMYGLTV